MCGIAGVVLSRPEVGAKELSQVAQRIGDALAHRGPDGSGTWCDAAVGVALAHRRLAIVDLTPAGAQPMASACGRFLIAFNGEIYNHRELRAELAGPLDGAGAWRGGSDTEVLLAAIARWGLAAALRRSTGMFALALWDRENRTLWLARDRFGEKPLYYGLVHGDLLFGSELKALRAANGTMPPVDREALALYLRHGYVPAPHSIHEGVYKLPPGTLVGITPAQVAAGALAQPEAYWSARSALLAARAAPFAGSLSEAADRLETLLRGAIGDQMLADVPVGAFLSGGIDSSTVVALMQQQGRGAVRTFTIGFGSEAFNEAHHARAVAEHLGTRHEELYVPPQAALDVVPQLPRIHDEPFGDSSAIPTFLVSRMAREQVTVSLSGDGGDEILGGYDRYFMTDSLAARLRRVPRPLRRAVGGLLAAPGAGFWNATLAGVGPLLPRRVRRTLNGDRLALLGQLLPSASGMALYEQLLAQWPHPERILVGGPVALPFPPLAADLAGLSLPQRMMYRDSVSYLPDDILTKVDRAAMAVGLETRAPLLDHRIYEFASSLPDDYRTGHGPGKRVLREVLARHVPSSLTERPKMGFGVPLTDWLRGPLRPWAEELLSPQRLRREGYFEAAPITARWNALQKSGAAVQHLIWDVLMFQAWLEQGGA